MPEPTEPGKPTIPAPEQSTPVKPEQSEPTSTPTQASENFNVRYQNRIKSTSAALWGVATGASITAAINTPTDLRHVYIGVAVGSAYTALQYILSQRPK